MRREPDFFGDQELVLIYVARRLKEALAVERVLDGGALDYTVVPTSYTGGFLFRTERVGAFFYVTLATEQSARALVRSNGFKPFEKP
jgi:hypothetical protein